MEAVLDALSVNFSTIILQVINLFVVMWFLYLILYKPIMRVLDERDNTIEGQLQDAENAKKDAKALLENYQTQMGKAQEEARSIMENAKKVGDETREQIVLEARKEANKTLERAKKEIEMEKMKALGQIQKEAATLAILAAGKVINKELNIEDHKRLVKEFVDEVGELQ